MTFRIRNRYDRDHVLWTAPPGVVSLIGADLRSADLKCANLRCADLKCANLRCADLREANLRCADLRGADLRGADLRGADLSFTYLRGADLRGARIQWNSHDLIVEILLSHAGPDIARRALAGLVLVSRDWCWRQWAELDHPEREWALGVLRQYVIDDDDDVPELLR